MAKKSVRKITNEFNKGISRREISRKAQNERRKLQRRLANELTDKIGEKVDWKESIKVYESSSVKSVKAKELYSDINKLSYRKEYDNEIRIGYEINIQSVEEKIINRFPNEQTQKRKNEMFKEELNQSTKKEGVSSLDSLETHGFYAATHGAWKGVDDVSQRNNAIMDAFGINDLETIYKLIVNKELKPEDFEFEDDELFKEWLDEIKDRVDLDELRKIMDEELSGTKDEPDLKYDKVRIGNIKTRASKVRYHV